ncbi:unnamed protein product [Urochloa decumbens]|uniref:Late embryogenesis abundant protein LEA-2 subgroup domain-containing protein n=1 Tax=Urochloa decumbens TaxID=240449 RepID=A0ABC9DQD3_9POAL
MKISRCEIAAILCAMLALALSPLIYYLILNLPPKFSVQLTDIQSLDIAAAAAPLTTFFNITLHASNKRGRTTACYRHGEAAVRYSGFTLARGRTPAFCVGAKEARDVRVVAWADGGVGLPKPIRDRMAAERRAGTVELEVDVKLFAEDDESGAEPTWMWCKVATGGGEKPTAATPCSVFRSMIWASDFAPNWMLV